MPPGRKISDDIWKRYATLASGGTGFDARVAACGISRGAARKFDLRDPASSGARWFGFADSLRFQAGKLQLQPIPFDKLTPEAKRGLEDFDFFRRRHFGNVSTPWQLETATRLIELMGSDDKEYVIENMCPGTGKTTLVHDLAAWVTARDRTIRGLIGSSANIMAVRMLGRLKRTFERRLPPQQDETLIRMGLAVEPESCLWIDYGAFKPEAAERWSRQEFTVAQHNDISMDEKEATWTAYGKDSSENLGMRYRLIFWDDLVNKKNMRSAEGREDMASWWEDEGETRLDRPGVAIVLGQRISSVDLYRHCLDMKDEEEQPKYHHIVYPAHDDEVCEQLHDKDSPAQGAGGCLLDPFRVTWRELQVIKRNRSEKYQVTYQQEDADPDNVLVDPLWLSGGTSREGVEHPGCWDRGRGLWELPDGPLLDPVGIVTADPSPSRFWAVQAWVYVPPATQQSRDEGMGGYRYLLDLENKTMEAPDLLDYNFSARKFFGILEEWWHNYRELGVPLRHVVVETNAAQRFLLQYDHAKRWGTQRNVEWIGHATHSRNKLDEKLGVPIVGPNYRDGRVRLPGSKDGRIKVAPLIFQVTRWPDTNQDDQVMANWFLEANLPTIWRPRFEVKRQHRPSWVRRAVALSS